MPDKRLRIQHNVYRNGPEELTRNEYFRLVNACDDNNRLKLIMQTFGSTGIRVSELDYFTVDAVRAGIDPGKVYPHNFRKLFAHEFYSTYKDLAALADVLGHSSIETTRIYIMTTGQEYREHIEMLDLIG